MLEIDVSFSKPEVKGIKSPIFPHPLRAITNDTIIVTFNSFFILPQGFVLIALFYTKASNCCINKSLGMLIAPRLFRCAFSTWQSIS